MTATTALSSRATEDLVNTLRNDVIPKAAKGKQMSADVGGTTASYIDLASEITNKLPLVIGIVLVLSFFLLLLAFRSLLVPLRAVVIPKFSIEGNEWFAEHETPAEWANALQEEPEVHHEPGRTE